MAYVLEVGTFEAVKLPYSYSRRAQATVHRTNWRQVAIHETSIDALKDYANKLRRPGLEFRVSGVGEHCLMQPEAI